VAVAAGRGITASMRASVQVLSEEQAGPAPMMATWTRMGRF
jgi:hypothetical protein